MINIQLTLTFCEKEFSLTLSLQFAFEFYINSSLIFGFIIVEFLCQFLFILNSDIVDSINVFYLLLIEHIFEALYLAYDLVSWFYLALLLIKTLSSFLTDPSFCLLPEYMLLLDTLTDLFQLCSISLNGAVFKLLLFILDEVSRE